MSPRAPKKCGKFGCEVRGTGHYCPAHNLGWNAGPKPRTSTPEHRAWRKEVLARDKGTCQIRGPRCTHRATEADHIINVAIGGAEFDLSNGQAVCSNCHKAKTQRESAAGRA
jgi:5-methylcytosine-specific restriction protein A